MQFSEKAIKRIILIIAVYLILSIIDGIMSLSASFGWYQAISSILSFAILFGLWRRASWVVPLGTIIFVFSLLNRVLYPVPLNSLPVWIQGVTSILGTVLIAFFVYFLL